MKNWAALTVGLYLVVLSAVCVPLICLSYPREASDLLAFFYIYVVPVLLLSQAVLLLVPIGVVNSRPVKKRRVVISAIIGAIPMTVMVLLVIGSVANIIWPEQSPSRSKAEVPGWVGLVIVGTLWCFWGMVFYRFFNSTNPETFTSKATRWLLGGSILEVIVAIPSHIISRQRGECCAPILSLLGIATGLSVALLAFGPSIFLLFVKRIREKTRNQG